MSGSIVWDFTAEMWKTASGQSLVDHLISEQALHVMTGGHWHQDKFGSATLAADYSPEKRVQFKLPYLVIPLEQVVTASVDRNVDYDKRFVLENRHGRFVKLFYHPSCHTDFSAFADGHGYQNILPEHSEFVATPTSSYRSLAVLKLDSSDSNKVDETFRPCIIKLGVFGSSVGATRDLTNTEVLSSVYISEHFLKDDGLDEEQFFLETSGVFHKQKVACGKEQSLTASNLVRELPRSIVENRVGIRYLSMAAVTSNLDPQALPIAYQLAQNYLQINHNKNLEDFLTHVIDKFLDFSTLLLFKGITIEPHAQNLGVVVNNWMIDKFFIRDGGGYALFDPKNEAASLTRQGYHSLRNLEETEIDSFLGWIELLGSNINRNCVTKHSWFFGYQVVQKLINLFSCGDAYDKYNLALSSKSNRYLVQSWRMTPLQIPAMSDRVPSPRAGEKVASHANQQGNATHTSLEPSLAREISAKKRLLGKKYFRLGIFNERLSYHRHLKLDDCAAERVRRYVSKSLIQRIKSRYRLERLPNDIQHLFEQFFAVEWSNKFGLIPHQANFHAFMSENEREMDEVDDAEQVHGLIF